MSLFDFNFYSGDIYGQNSSRLLDFFKTLTATAFGVVLTKGHEWWSEKKKINQDGKDLINEILLLDEPIKKQIDSINKFIETLKEENFQPTIVTMNVLLDTQRIKDINRSNVILFIQKSLKNRKQALEKANKIFASIDIIAQNRVRINGLFENLIDRGTIHFDQWKRNINEIIRTTSEIIIELERKKIQINSDPFANDLHDLVKGTLLQKKELDMLVLKKEFHTPLIVLLYQHRFDERTKPFGELNFQCIQSIKEIEALKKEMIFKYGKIAESLNKNNEVLVIAINEIES